MQPGTGFYVILAVAIAAAAFLRARLDTRPGARRIYDGFARIELIVIVALLATLMGVGVLQIILRNTLRTGILWADPLMRHIVLWLGALGASLATARMRHINIDVFTRLLPDSLRPYRRFLVYVATAAGAFMLGVSSLRLVIDEREFGATAFAGLDTWTLQVVLPFAFFLIAYRSLVNLFLGREPRHEGEEIEAT